MPRRIEDYRGLAQLSRVKLLHAVQKTPGRRLQELANEAGIHINTAREHLRVLEDEGLVTSRPVATGARGRPPAAFHPVDRPTANPHADRRVTEATAQGDLLRRISPELDHSPRLGTAAVHQLDALYSHLEDVGLEPDLDEEALTFRLRPCRFHRMIDEHGTMVCDVHTSLVTKQLAQTPGPLGVDRVEPFVTPHRCDLILTLHEKRRSPFPGAAEHAGDHEGEGPHEHEQPQA